jgi:hypothetical protein
MATRKKSGLDFSLQNESKNCFILQIINKIPSHNNRVNLTPKSSASYPVRWATRKGGTSMIIENRLMWPPVCFRWDLNDEAPRWPHDSLMHTIYTSAASEILITPSDYMVEAPPIKFYDVKVKESIYNKNVKPILEAAFAPRGASSLPSEPFKIDEKGRLIFIWDDLEEFFVNLLWCSKLRIPFVFDVNRLHEVIVSIRNDLVRDGLLADPRILNDLVAIMSLWRKKDVWCLLPLDSSRGSALDIWKQLRSDRAYRILSHETRKLGIHRFQTVDDHISRIQIYAGKLIENRVVSNLVGLSKSTVSLFLGAEVKFASEAISRIASFLFAKKYIPPIYSLTDIESDFEKTFYGNS